jgi:choline kinase/mannose-6-phosphate isomerase-like protein (cupin superfamily)/thiamine kinase-like enzyme
MKTVYKPWGKEEWLELNDKYCYKRIYINAGHKTSYQYHEIKQETNYLISGTAEIWLENENGEVEKKIMGEGEYFSIPALRKHRVIAITDIILQEVSTPEVDDVIRIEDDSGRDSGKLNHEHMRPALCLLTAGIGSRLGDLSDHINKGLLPLNNKAIISHLIEKTGEDYEIVVALGYKGKSVKEYCEAAHPNRDFIFVEVDNYRGEGSGPAYSISRCKEHLQRPFIWVAADTVVLEKSFPLPNSNWLGLYPTDIPELYATAEVENGRVTNLKDKDKNGYAHGFIGLAGVYDFNIFWDELDINSGEIVSAYKNVSRYPSMTAAHFNWYDVGTVDNYVKAKNIIASERVYSIPKTNGEFLYKVKDRFIKLSSDLSFIEGRIERAKTLDKLVPPLVYSGENLYAYDWVEGQALYDYNDKKVWAEFLEFLEANMWERLDVNIEERCRIFYKEKTLKRLSLLLSDKPESYQGPHVVNGTSTRPIHELLDNFPWENVTRGVPTKIFHGDLHFDNSMRSDDGRFYLLDWRQNFAGGDIGDVYYDLSKMYGGLLMSYKLTKDEESFSCSVNDDLVSFRQVTTSELQEFKPIYEDWLDACGYDLNKVKLITSLIFLNMAPLHERELGDLLFFKSKKMMEELSD